MCLQPFGPTTSTDAQAAQRWNTQSALKIEESHFRIYKLHWLAALLQDELACELEEVFEDLDEKEVAQIFGFPIAADAEDLDDPVDPATFAELLRELRKFGLFAQIHIPRQHYKSSECKESRWSWNRCYLRYVYAETLEELILEAERQVQECDRLDILNAATEGEL